MKTYIAVARSTSAPTIPSELSPLTRALASYDAIVSLLEARGYRGLPDADARAALANEMVTYAVGGFEDMPAVPETQLASRIEFATRNILDSVGIRGSR